MNMQVRTEEGKIKDVNILDVTPENFIVPKGEEDCYHCRIEVKKFNADTGERVSKPRMQVFGKKFFESYGLHNLRKQGYTVDIMHDPNDWIKANEEKKAFEEAQKAAEEEQKKAEALEAEKAKMKAELKESMKAEVMAELKAELMAEMKAEAGAVAGADDAAKPGRKPKGTKEDAAEVKEEV